MIHWSSHFDQQKLAPAFLLKEKLQRYHNRCSLRKRRSRKAYPLPMEERIKNFNRYYEMQRILSVRPTTKKRERRQLERYQALVAQVGEPSSF